MALGVQGQLGGGFGNFNAGPGLDNAFKADPTSGFAMPAAGGAAPSGAATSVPAWMTNPLVGLGIAGVGAFASFLGARSQKNHFNDMQGRIDQALSPEALDETYQGLLGRSSGAIQAMRTDSRLQGQAQGGAAMAQFRRAGLSGVGETVSQGIQSGITSRSQRASEAFKFELMKQAQQQQYAQVQAMQGLMQTPFGGVSPAQASLAGAGAGLEAFGNSAYAEQFYGRRAQ